MVLVIIFVVLIALAIVGGIFGSKMRLQDDWDMVGSATCLLSSIATVILTIILAISHGTANSTIVQYNTIKETIEASRQEDTSDFERAALTQKIMEVNQEIASYKYWNGTIFHLMVPDRLTELEPLK